MTRWLSGAVVLVLAAAVGCVPTGSGTGDPPGDNNSTPRVHQGGGNSPGVSGGQLTPNGGGGR